MKTLGTAAILLISLNNAMAQSSAGTSVVWQSPAQQQPAAASSGWASTTPMVMATEPGSSSVVIAGTRVQQVSDLEAQAREMVLVVPGPELKPEAFAAITEDLTVMARIFDKALYPGKRPTGAWASVSRGESLAWLFTQQSGRTQSLYLDGYGAVFFTQVDFPLVGPPQEKQESKPDESADRVWSQTMDELRGREERQDADETGPAYDAQNVESLKAALIKTLRHAANLRLRPQDQVTVVVGSQNDAGGAGRQQLNKYFFYSSGHRRYGPAPKTATRTDNPQPDPAATLILRVTKADVDALAAGKLTADQFAPKVQIFWSAAQPQTAESPSTQPPTTVSR